MHTYSLINDLFCSNSTTSPDPAEAEDNGSNATASGNYNYDDRYYYYNAFEEEDETSYDTIAECFMPNSEVLDLESQIARGVFGGSYNFLMIVNTPITRLPENSAIKIVGVRIRDRHLVRSHEALQDIYH